MRAFSLQELCPPLSASLHGSDASIIGVSTDSRSIRPGDLFVALSGDRFDGHNYLEQVAGYERTVRRARRLRACGRRRPG